MADYTRTWNSSYELTPDGGDQRSSVDDRIREVKVDTRERMESLANWTSTDPVSLKPTAPVNHDNKKLYIHGSSFMATVNSTGEIRWLLADGAAKSIRAAVTTGSTGVSFTTACSLPATALVSNITAMVSKNSFSASNSVSVLLQKHSYGAAIPSTAIVMGGGSTISVTSTTPVLATASGSVIIDPADASIYFIEVTMGTVAAGFSSLSLYGVCITYNVLTLAALR